MILKACEESELTPCELGLLPEITLWIDPQEVCARWVTGWPYETQAKNDSGRLKQHKGISLSSQEIWASCCHDAFCGELRRILWFEKDFLPLRRSGENSRPFTIACFSEEGQEEEAVKGEQDDCSVDSINLDTSDYHSATSSDCGSTASSDTEEEAKDGETEGEQEKDENVVKNKAAEGDTYTVVMVPRIRKRHGEGPNKIKYVRNMVNGPSVGISELKDTLYIFLAVKLNVSIFLDWEMFAILASCCKKNNIGWKHIDEPALALVIDSY